MYKYMGNGLNGNVGKLLKKYIAFEEKGDVFIHLAAKSNGTYKEIVESNVNYLIKTIDFCKEEKIKNFIFFSAISIYNRDDLYSVSKKLGEKILEETDLNVLIIRLPMVLTQEKENGVLNRIRKKLVKNEDVFLYNANKKFNNFISVEEIADFIKKYRFNRKFEIVDLGSELDYSLYEIVNYMKRILNSKSSIYYKKGNNLLQIDLEKAKYYNFKSKSVEEKIKEWFELHSKEKTD